MAVRAFQLVVVVLVMIFAGLYGCSSNDNPAHPGDGNGADGDRDKCLSCHGVESTLKNLLPEEENGEPDEGGGDG
jgi:hypothetical protein